LPFICPMCKLHELNIITKIELGPDSSSDEIMLQIIMCYQCDFSGIAIYEESRRGSLDDDSFDHYGYRIGKNNLRSLREIIIQCPEPSNRRCECFAHHTLNIRDTSGRWNALSDVHLDGSFAIKR
jgi:hypothetical protein